MEPAVQQSMDLAFAAKDGQEPRVACHVPRDLMVWTAQNGVCVRTELPAIGSMDHASVRIIGLDSTAKYVRPVFPRYDCHDN